MEDYYTILGVASTATADEIKQSYRRLASRHHPDKGGDTATFQKIEEAYRVLGDERSRSEYDNRGRQFEFHQRDFQNPFDHFHVNINNGHVGIGDLFNSLFRNARPQQAQRRNRDLRITVELSLPETLTSHVKIIRYNNGKNESSTVEISIPAGIEDGAVIKYPELGDDFFNTLPRGDLYVNIRHVDSDGFGRISRTDIACEYEIECWDAMLGTTLTIKGLDGTLFNVRVPAGTQPGTRLNLRGQGLYHDQRLTERGNLFVVLRVRVPAMGDAAREHIEQLKKLV